MCEKSEELFPLIRGGNNGKTVKLGSVLLTAHLQQEIAEVYYTRREDLGFFIDTDTRIHAIYDSALTKQFTISGQVSHCR